MTGNLAMPWIADEEAWEEVLRPLSRDVLVDARAAAMAWCQRAFARFPDIRPEVPEAAVEAATANFTLLFSAVQEGVAPEDVGFPPVSAAFAHQCARAGLGVTKAVEVGGAGAEALHHLCLSRTSQVCREPTLLAPALTSISTFIVRYVDHWFVHMTEEYLVEREQLHRDTESRREELVHEILSGGGVAEESASYKLGYDLSGRHRAFILWTSAAAGHSTLPHEALKVS
jgi:hypothetical protein